MKSAGRALRLGLEIHFKPARQASTSSGEGKSLSPFVSSVFSVALVSHFPLVTNGW
jgi:hypothetical protein